MTAYTIIRGDSYSDRRPLFRYEFIEDTGDPMSPIAPLNLTGMTVRTTFKLAPTDAEDDPEDASAVITGDLVVDGTGVATLEDGLFLVGAASAGIVEHRLDKLETADLPAGQKWVSDIEITDAEGEVFTFFFDGDTLEARDGITNRSS